MNSRQRVLAVLEGKIPDRAVFAPNIWQWFEYQKLHGLLPPELQDCKTQLEVMKHLGVDIFSRNLLTDIRTEWIGGHVQTSYSAVEVEETAEEGNRRKIVYHTPHGDLSEVFLFDTEGCTLVQDEYLFKDFDSEYQAWKDLLTDREYEFDEDSFHNLEKEVGENGLVMVSETTTPLKQLHFAARADNTVYLLYDHEKEMLELMKIYEEKALKLIAEMVSKGVRAVCSMDNLDSLFYTPDFFERYCSEFFSKAAEICHQRGAWFFSHACGRQREIMQQVVACGLDGLEGIAFPPLGDIELWEAKTAGERFIVEGGLSAVQLEGDVTGQDAERYVKNLFEKMKPFDRFIFSMSCNTSIFTRWDTLRYFRDAWLKYAAM